MKEYEISCVVKDNSGVITQLGFSDQGIHSILIITRLILSGRVSFYINKNGNRVKVVVKESTIYNEFFIDDDDENIDIDDLDFLPKCYSQNEPEWESF
ncbi:MAG: hypothetical protein M3162_00265 [Thermoproteota archaeon]|nr:hypothetical protein [Thermoproteota archaeon]